MEEKEMKGKGNNYSKKKILQLKIFEDKLISQKNKQKVYIKEEDKKDIWNRMKRMLETAREVARLLVVACIKRMDGEIMNETNE